MYEVLVVGAGPAGMSAALVLGRSRRRVLVCDSGRPRNAVTPAMHGYLSRDGLPPPELRRIGREELAHYPEVAVRDEPVLEVARDAGGFVATLGCGERVRARKLLLATGVVDELPAVPGLPSLYGRAVWHCPYCDGYELADRPLAVYGKGARATSELRALTRFSRDLVVCTDGDDEFGDAERACIESVGASVRTERVVRLEPRPDGLAIVFDAGPVVERAGLFFSTALHQRSKLAESLGCSFDEGGLIVTEDNQASGVPGVYVAGDAARSVLLAIVAAGEGAQAAFAINRELLREEFP
ncbi:MAG: NAD(P)/FAD-dependent oxidoreductase [Proteobacteria bacterium]|nr:MAG: NAD(P)/FAD-dependent oxidoreductase [Pseudomonadota bacterium]